MIAECLAGDRRRATLEVLVVFGQLLERPGQFAGTPRLTDAELETLKARAAALFGPETDAVFGDSLYLALLDDSRPRQLGATGTYSSNWLPDRFSTPPRRSI